MLGRYREKKYTENIEYNPQNIENILKKFSELTNYINRLENSLKDAEDKTHMYEDKLLKYERIFKEEIALYRLHRSNISVINQTLNEDELFVNEIQEHIQSFISKQDNGNNKPEKRTPFDRIFSRYFHQNKLYKYRVRQKLSELNETIDKKNRLLERMQGEIQTWDTHNTTRLLPAQQISVN